ncbi:MAG: sugar phosphate nucleotidyltransferase, partial [Gemmatimonadota bacterium]|nr:sugar phosphate nucleotidyltransferase [Gemmatimonadota bacterium]
TNGSLVEEVAAELPEVPGAAVIGEPEGKNTAPAIGLAAGLLHAREEDAVMLALPADHAIGDPEAFRETVERAFQVAAESPVLVLFGVVPSRPETGYGYIERGEPASVTGEGFEVARFVEKPDPETARSLWRDGRHFWNSGLFCGRAATFLEEYAEHLPLMRRAIDAAVDGWESDPGQALERYYASVEATSIDYGIMQQCERAVMVTASGWGWDDVGSWDALARWSEPDERGNVTVGRAEARDCDDVIAYAQEGRIAVLGMEDCVVVRSAGETLVVHRDALGGLKEFVREVRAGSRVDPER